jgi:hypothetical protein
VLIIKVIRLPNTKGVDEELECVAFRSIVQIRALIESRERIGYLPLKIVKTRRGVGVGVLGGLRTNFLVTLVVGFLAVATTVHSRLTTCASLEAWESSSFGSFFAVSAGLNFVSHNYSNEQLRAKRGRCESQD